MVDALAKPEGRVAERVVVDPADELVAAAGPALAVGPGVRGVGEEDDLGAAAPGRFLLGRGDQLASPRPRPRRDSSTQRCWSSQHPPQVQP